MLTTVSNRSLTKIVSYIYFIIIEDIFKIIYYMAMSRSIYALLNTNHKLFRLLIWFKIIIIRNAR